MCGSDEPVGILNPDNYLNHLSPTEGSALQIENDVFIVILGAALWDIFAYLSIDAKIVRGSRFNPTIFSFIFTRLTSLGFICLSIVSRVPPVIFDPGLVPFFAGCLCMLSLMTSSFLLLQRVLVIYQTNNRIRWGFSIFWLVVALSRISEIVTPFTGSPEDSPESGIHVWVTTCLWLALSFDTAVTLAISYKLWKSYRLPHENVPWYQSIIGRTLPRLPRIIFRGGIQYYLILIGMVLMTVIVLSIHSVPKSYNAMSQTILVFLMASMTSRVFRNLKLFDSQDEALSEFQTPSTT